MRGTYIVIEGADGTGKNTQVELLKSWLKEQGINVFEQEISEPAGTPFADAVRTVIKNGHLERDALANLLLFNAARRSIYLDVIAPALARGEWIVSARNYLSSLVVQGHAEGLDRDEILRRVSEDTAPDYLNPDLVIVLDITDETARAQRIRQRGELEKPDTFEMRAQEFQDAVLDGYREEAKRGNYPLIDAGQTIEEIQREIVDQLKRFLH